MEPLIATYPHILTLNPCKVGLFDSAQILFYWRAWTHLVNLKGCGVWYPPKFLGICCLYDVVSAFLRISFYDLHIKYDKTSLRADTSHIFLCRIQYSVEVVILNISFVVFYLIFRAYFLFNITIIMFI
jgi:hypothetical protein